MLPMKKINSLFVFLLLAFSLCAQQQGKYSLHVKVEDTNASAKSSFLIIPTEGQHFIMKRVKNSEYEFNLDSCFTYPQPIEITYYSDCNQKQITDLKIYGQTYVHPTQIIDFYFTDTINSLVIHNDTILLLNPNVLQEKYRQINDEMNTRINSFNKSIRDKLHEAYNQTKIQKEKDSIQSLSENLFKTNVARPNLDSTLMPAIQNNLDNAISVFAMKRYLYIARMLQLNIPVSTFQALLDSMPEKLKQYEIWKELDNTVKTIQPNKTLVGSTAPEFVDLKDTSGNTVYLKDFKGKVIFIDFWASWCVPCMAQVPQLKNIYRSLQNKNVEFIGISLDYHQSNWTNEIKNSGLNWINLTDLKSIDGMTSVEYNISTIPHNFLIDKNGTVVDENISLDNLGEKIEKLLH